MSVNKMKLTLCVALCLTFCALSASGSGCAFFGHSCIGGHGKRSGLGGVVQGRDLAETGSAEKWNYRTPRNNYHHPPSFPINSANDEEYYK